MKLNNKNKIIFDAIDEILWKEWDPIGINDDVNIGDEYSGYVPHIFKLKTEGADVVKIAKHLHQIATVSMGISLVDMEHCKFIAQMILEI